MIADELGMSKETVRNILIRDLGMRKLAVKLVPTDFDFEEQLQENNTLDRVITGNETWSCQHDPEDKRQSKEWR
jgi:hypothetical protein